MATAHFWPRTSNGFRAPALTATNVGTAPRLSSGAKPRSAIESDDMDKRKPRRAELAWTAGGGCPYVGSPSIPFNP